MDREFQAVEGDAADDLRRFLEERISEHNVAATGMTDGRAVAFAIRHEDGAIVAGLFGWTWGGCLYVEHLWVRDGVRGRGYGSRLLAAAERVGRERGCALVTLETHDFQAPDFYRRHGYDVFATLDDYPMEHKKHFLRKRLS